MSSLSLHRFPGQIRIEECRHCTGDEPCRACDSSGWLFDAPSEVDDTDPISPADREWWALHADEEVIMDDCLYDEMAELARFHGLYEEGLRSW